MRGRKRHAATGATGFADVLGAARALEALEQRERIAAQVTPIGRGLARRTAEREHRRRRHRDRRRRHARPLGLAHLHRARCGIIKRLAGNIAKAAAAAIPTILILGANLNRQRAALGERRRGSNERGRDSEHRSGERTSHESTSGFRISGPRQNRSPYKKQKAAQAGGLRFATEKPWAAIRPCRPRPAWSSAAKRRRFHPGPEPSTGTFSFPRR